MVLFSLSLLLAGLTFATPEAQAVERHLAIDGAKVVLDIPAQWQIAPDLLGIPLTILGDETGDNRPVLAIVPTGAQDIHLDERELSGSQSEFKEGREGWLAERGGKALAFFPYRKFKNRAGLEIHAIGYRYQISTGQFEETSYVLTCANQLFLLQSLLRVDQRRGAGPKIDQMVESFRCE